MTERLNGAGTNLLERSQERVEALRISPEAPQALARRAFVLDEIATADKPASLLSQGREQAADATLGAGKTFNSQI